MKKQVRPWILALVFCVALGAAWQTPGIFTTLDVTGDTTLGDAAGDTLTVNAIPYFEETIRTNDQDFDVHVDANNNDSGYDRFRVFFSGEGTPSFQIQQSGATQIINFETRRVGDAASEFYIKLADAAGADSLEIRDSGSNSVWTGDSDGNTSQTGSISLDPNAGDAGVFTVSPGGEVVSNRSAPTLISVGTATSITASSNFITYVATGNGDNMELDDPATFTNGRTFRFFATNVGGCTLVTHDDSSILSGAASKVLAQWDSVGVQTDGTNWLVF